VVSQQSFVFWQNIIQPKSKNKEGAKQKTRDFSRFSIYNQISCEKEKAL